LEDCYICHITGYSRSKVQAALKRSTPRISPKRTHYLTLQIDEFWTFVGKKCNKVWLIYAYDLASGEIVAYVRGTRNLATVIQLKQRLKALGATYDRIASDYWVVFFNRMSVKWENSTPLVLRRITTACATGHPARYVKPNVSKGNIYHLKVFTIGFFYINYGHV
jgi:IS1 transposase